MGLEAGAAHGVRAVVEVRAPEVVEGRRWQ